MKRRHNLRTIPSESDTLLRSLSERLREVRDARCMSIREAARIAGISPSHLHELESGEIVPRVKTLASLLEAYPELTPEFLTGRTRDPTRPISATRVQFMRTAQTLGLAADRVILGYRLLRIEGLRTTNADATDPLVRLALMRAATHAPRATRELVELETERLDDEGQRHVYSFDHDGLTYERRGATGLTWHCLIPARELHVRVPDAKRWTIDVRSETGGQDIADELHPHRRSGHRDTFIVDCPVVGTVYTAKKDPVPWTALPGAVMRKHRKAAGLNLRELSAAAGFSLNTCSAVELGAQSPTLTTLLGYLETLPSLPLRRILPGRLEGGGDDAPSLFECAVSTAGLVCDELIKEVVIAEDGTREMTITTRGLRSVRGDLLDREVVLPRLLGRAGGEAGLPASVVGQLENPAVSQEGTHELEDGRLVLQWAKRRGAFGVDFVRTYQPKLMYAMTAERLELATGRRGSYFEGAMAGAVVPAHQLRLVVRLPLGFPIDGAAAHRWPLQLLPDPQLPQWSAVAPPLGVDAGPDGVRLSASVNDAAPGLALHLSWPLR